MKNIFFFLFSILIAIPFPLAIAISPNDEEIRTQVTRVSDGDTFSVIIDDQEEKVRILGIDTPELDTKNSNPVCNGSKATALTKALLLNKNVTLLRDAQNENRDSFGRLLRIAKLNGRIDIAILLLATGNAAVYDKADFTAKPLYQKLEKRAQAANRGIWGECGGLPKTKTPNTSSPADTQSDKNRGSHSGSPSPTVPATGTCSIKAACGRLTTCDEAKYYLNTCGQKNLDQDGDGTPCEELCK